MDAALTVKLPAVPPFKVGRISVPHSDLTLSRIAYGSLHFPEFKDNVTGLTAALEACQKVGVTTIDLADVYGWIEDGHGAANDIFAEALKASPGLRSKLELVTKFGIRLSGGYHIDLSPEWIHESLDRYLTLFDTDYVDVLMIHNPDPNMDVQAVAQAFKEIKEARKARAFGISNFHQWEYEALRDAMAAEGLKLSVHEMETSVLHPDRITDDTVSYFSTGENELRILGWGALGGDPYGGSNLLFGSEGEREKRIVETLALKGQELALEEDAGLGKKQTVTFGPDEVAVAWLLHHPGNIVPIIGTTAVARLMAQTTPAEKIPFRDLDFDDIMSALHY
jgi:predicted oxidoreductase